VAQTTVAGYGVQSGIESGFPQKADQNGGSSCNSNSEYWNAYDYSSAVVVYTAAADYGIQSGIESGFPQEADLPGVSSRNSNSEY